MKQLKGLMDKVKGLDGEPVLDDQERPLLVKEVLANSLARAMSQDAVRAMAVALKFYHATSKLVLDDQDITVATKALNDDRFYTNIAKVPALQVLANATEVEPNRAQRRKAKKAQKA